MGYLLLALENLAVSLLFVALVVALASGCRGWVRLLLALAGVAIWLVFYVVVVMVDYNQEFVADNVNTGLFVPLLTLTALFVAGAATIVYRGLRVGSALDSQDDAESYNLPSARFWPRSKLGLALGVAVLLNLMTLSNLYEAARESLNTLRADAHALAMSIAPAAVPDEQNAATYYLQVFDALKREDLYTDRPENRWHPLYLEAVQALDDAGGDFDYDSAGMSEFFAAHQGEIDLLRTGAALPHYYYDRDGSRLDITALVPDFDGMRDAIRLLAVHARHRAAAGDTKSALADVTAMAALARHAGGRAIVIMSLTSITFDRMTFETLQVVLRSENPSTDALAEARVNHLFSHRRQANRILRADEAAMLNTMADLDAQLALSTVHWLGGTDTEGTYFGHRTAALSIFGLGPFYRLFVVLPSVTAYRRAMQRIHYVASLPYNEFLEERKRIEPDLEGQGVFVSAASGSFNVIRATYYGDAYNLVAYTALAMHRYRAQHGHFPDRLAELTPKVIPIVPGDPFSKQPLKLAQTKRGWVVYSVGPDTIDNHGAPLETDDMEQLGDIAFEYVGAKER